MSAVSDDLLEALAATAESIGAPPLSRMAKEFMCRDLEQYPETAVLMALSRVRREVKTQKLTLADIIERIDDGRPGAEAAWSAVSDSTEAKTLVLTEEMQEALAAAAPLMPGDLVAARMAFIETYRRLILTGRAEGRPIKWRVSLGQDPVGRLPALREAVEKGRIKAADARALLPAHEAQTLTMPEAEARRALEAGEARAGQTVQKLLADPRAVVIPAQSGGLTQAERAELEAFDSRPRGAPWSRRDVARHQELLGKLRADRVVDRGAMQGLAAGIRPQPRPSKRIDRQATEQKLRDRHGETR